MAHQKHAKLAKPIGGKFGRLELGILGTPCGEIKNLAEQIIRELGSQYKIGYVDADHAKADHKDQGINEVRMLASGGSRVFTNKISFGRLDSSTVEEAFTMREQFSDCDLVIVNGNHFEADAQIAVSDSRKDLQKKKSKLTNVVLVIENDLEAPQELEIASETKVLNFADKDSIVEFVKDFVATSLPAVNGLVLAGGKSTRMGHDKGLIEFHGQPQREYAAKILESVCEQVYISCRPEQMEGIANPIVDSFSELGPYGGILSAFRKNPNTAWLTVACDLPFLDESILKYLIENRNSSKLATCFMDSDNQFPEPLITVWEPRAYPQLLKYLSLGYSCPRKVLINSEVQTLQVPNLNALTNVNSQEDLEKARAVL